MSRPPEFQPATQAKLAEIIEGAAKTQLGWSKLREQWGK
jgi:hypothetical protein